MNLARNTEFAVGAEQMKQIFDEYLRAGFTEYQALELLKALIAGAGKNRE